MQYAMITTAVLVGAILASNGAQAAPKAATIGKASVDDVTLNKDYSDALAFSAGVNPMQGPDGFSSAFSKTGTGTWSAIEKVDKNGTVTDLSKLFDFTFAKTSGTVGTWTITNVTKDTNAVLDLSVAIHAGNASTAFLFDNQAVNAGQTLSGTWKIDWLNNGGNVPGFSNLVVFSRDLLTTPVKTVLLPVPEPTTLPMLGAGLAVVGLLARRRKK